MLTIATDKMTSIFHVHNWIQYFFSVCNYAIANNNHDFELDKEVSFILN